MSHAIAAPTLARFKKEAKRLARLAQLKRECQRLDIKQREVAAACEPPVDVSLVTHVLAGRAKSSNVERTAKRLISERRPA